MIHKNLSSGVICLHGKNPKKPDIKSQLLIIIQTSLCLVVIIAAVVLKSIGGQFYANAASWYFDTINNSVFTEGIAIFNPPADKSEIKETSNISPTTDNAADLDGEIMQNAAKPMTNNKKETFNFLRNGATNVPTPNLAEQKKIFENGRN